MRSATESVSTVSRTMLAFAERTGLAPVRERPTRYLWTDALAVCNFLALYSHTDEPRYIGLAEALIGQVHHVLGRHRDDDVRRGWISGLDEVDGERHPTAGGLRIGKRLPERARDAPVDESLEWDRDGQYLHYLTKWAHALCRANAVTGRGRYYRWAAELVATAHRGFLQGDAHRQAHYAWKMSIDLAYPLVPSPGMHDALDVFITGYEVAARDDGVQDGGLRSGLTEAMAQAGRMIGQARWATADPLGIGGLLFDAARVAALIDASAFPDAGLDARLLDEAALGLQEFARSGGLRAPAQHRLAFRELGLSAGLRALPAMRAGAGAARGDRRAALARLDAFEPLADDIEAFWLEPAHQRAASWRDHADINSVTLATSLLPSQYVAA